jgi:hypothetical protein
MFNSAIVIQWGTAVAGRENLGLEVFMSAVKHYSSLKERGEIENFQTVIFEQGSVSNTAGLMVLSGTQTQLQTVLSSDKHRELLTKAAHIVSDIRLQYGSSGSGIESRIQDLVKWRKELGL